MTGISLLAGPDPLGGMEAATSHRTRLGALPVAGPGLIEALERSDLRGRGGAAHEGPAVSFTARLITQSKEQICRRWSRNAARRCGRRSTRSC